MTIGVLGLGCILAWVWMLNKASNILFKNNGDRGETK